MIIRPPTQKTLHYHYRIPPRHVGAMIIRPPTQKTLHYHYRIPLRYVGAMIIRSPDLIAQAKSRVRYDRAISQGYRRDGCVLWVIGMESRVESA